MNDSYPLNACLKRCVLRSFLNVRKFSLLMLSGNAFQSTGAPTLKDLSAKVLHLVIGLTSKSVFL